MIEKLGQGPGNAAAPRVGSPSAAMGRLIERGGAAIAALKARMEPAAGLAEADQRLRGAEAHAERVWQEARLALQGPAGGRAMALGADL